MADPTPTMRERAQLSVRAVAAKRDLGLIVGPDDETAFVDAVLAELEHPTEKPQTPAPDWDARARSAEDVETIARAILDDIGNGVKLRPDDEYTRIISVQLSSADFRGMARAAIAVWNRRAGLSDRDAGWQSIESAREDLRAQLPYIAAPKLGQHIGRVATMPNGDWVILMFDSDKGRFTQFMTAPSPWRAPPDPKDQQAP